MFDECLKCGTICISVGFAIRKTKCVIRPIRTRTPKPTTSPPIRNRTPKPTTSPPIRTRTSQPTSSPPIRNRTLNPTSSPPTQSPISKPTPSKPKQPPTSKDRTVIEGGKPECVQYDSRSTPLTLDDVEAILSDDNNNTANPPYKAKAGDIYVYDNEQKENDWRCDGYNWKNNGKRWYKHNGKEISKTYFE